MRNHSETGSSFVEFLLAMVGSAVVCGLTLSALTTSSNFYGDSMGVAVIRSQARRAVDALSEEIQWGDPASIIISQENGADRIDFQVPAAVTGGSAVLSSPITYRWEASNVDANHNGISDEGQVVRIQNGNRRVLCHYVKPGGLTIQRSDEQIALRLELFTATGEGTLTQVEGTTSVTLHNQEQ
jgi:hypothetical protein